MIPKEGVGPTALSSSHFLFQKCLQHALRPNRTMSPRFDARGLSRRYSRKRPCGRGVVPPFGGVTFPRLGPFTSTSLLPFAPPRLAARLPRYYESSDFCRAASSDLTGIAKFVPFRRAIPHRGPGPLLTPRPPLRVLTMDRPRSSPDRSPGLSRLTFQPLHLQPPHCHFVTVALARYFSAVTCRVYPSGQTIQVEGMAVARSRVRSSPGASPTGLAKSSSLALRMGRSSQVALHLSSRKRSYHCRLQAGNVSLEGTCTLLIKRLHRRTGTWILPGSHRQPNNPTGDVALDPKGPCPGEVQVSAAAGSVIAYDSRLWHATATNRSQQPRVALAIRYAPWWLNLQGLMRGTPDYEASLVTGRIPVHIPAVPPSVFERLPEKTKSLFAHWVRP